MFHSQTFLCLDFGAGSVKAAEFAVNETGGLSLKQYGIKALGAEGFQDSKREKAVLIAVRDLLAERGFSTRQASLCAPGFQVFSKIVKLPPVDNAKVRQIIQYEAQQNVPYPLDEAVWDFQILGTSPGGELEVMLVAIKADAVERYFQTAEATGLRLELVDASTAALCNAFRFNYGESERCSMLLDIGAKTSNVLFFEKGKVFARSINIGANAITQDFVAETKIPYAKAEELKLTQGSVSLGGAFEEPEDPHQAAIAKIARQVMTRLHIQVNQTIQFYRGQQGGSTPTRLFLAGGASIMPYTAQFFAEKLNIGVEYFNPFRNVTLAPEIDLDELAKVAHGFGEVVGLGLRKIAQCPVEMNLVPKSIRSKQDLNRKKAYFIATAASLVAVIFAVGAFFNKSAAIKRESLAELNQQFLPLQKRAEELDQTQRLIQQVHKELNVFTGYLRDRFFWPEALVEMRDLLVKVEDKSGRPGQEAGVWIEKFGTVDEPEPDEPADRRVEPPFGSIEWVIKYPEMAKRYLPQLYAIVEKSGLLKNRGQMMMAATTAPTAGTNLVTLNVKFRAVSMNTKDDPAANGRLAFAVADEFKKSGYFDPEGTKLSGELEEAEPITKEAGTFGFGMVLKLKNEMM